MTIRSGDPHCRTIAIIGAGAIGGWIGARLALAGHDVRLLARGDTLERIHADGLLLTDGDTVHARVRASARPEELGPAEILIIAVKAPALALAAQAAASLMRPETIVVPMLNGVPWWFLAGERLESVDPDGRIAGALPLDRVVGCVVHASCSRAAPNHVVVKHAKRLILGDTGGGASPRVAGLCELFARSGIVADSTDDIRRSVWYKLWGNATINPLSALTRSTADRLIAEPAIRAFMLEAMAELAAVGAAVDCPIAETGEDRIAVTARLGAFKTSMLQDVEAGRPIELEALLGAPIEIARKAGVETPRLDALYALTRVMAESLRLG